MVRHLQAVKFARPKKTSVKRPFYYLSGLGCTDQNAKQGNRTVPESMIVAVGKDFTNQDDCYWKFYLYAHEGHGKGWSKLQFWQIWFDSRGHSALGSTALMIDSPKSMQVQIHLRPTFVFHSPSWVLIRPTAWNLWQSSIWAGLKLSSIHSSLHQGFWVVKKIFVNRE